MNDKNMSTFSIEEEYLEFSNRNAWPIIYQNIGRKSQSHDYTCKEAKKVQNKHLNRYRDVNPYDHSRIILKRSECDYINANFVTMKQANRKYILTQGPLSSTVGHFWLMVWEQKSRAIIMLNKIVEKNEIKCHWYWPQAVGEKYKMVLSDMKLTVEQVGEEDCDYYTTRIFRISDKSSGESREVIQFHYTTWPDFGVPSSPVAFLEFLQKVRQSRALDPDVGPPVVHCSAGIGRSGTFCLVDSCLVITEKQCVAYLNIVQILLEMRKGRMGLIQTPDQLRFSYLAIIEGIKRFNSESKDEKRMAESIYSPVADDFEDDDDECPPSPPPRGESLTKPKLRPKLVRSNTNILPPEVRETPFWDTSDSDERPPTPPAFASFEDDGDNQEEQREVPERKSESEESSETPAKVRRRRKHVVEDQPVAMKRRTRIGERWRKLKRLRSKKNKPQRETRKLMRK